MSSRISHLVVLLIPAIGFAQGYEKNGLPCIAELCLGDGLSQLGKIKWDRARSDFSITGKPDYVGSRSLPASAGTAVKNAYRGDLTKAIPYLSYEAFDGEAIAMLGNVTAACSRRELKGVFVSQAGNPTTVKIALLSDKKDIAVQRWTVTSISRNFPSATSDMQKADVRRQLDDRYGRFSVSHGIQRGIEAMYNIHDDPMSKSSYGFSLLLKIPINESERERQHPACGGQRKVSVE